jgi:hypothetical protein
VPDESCCFLLFTAASVYGVQNNSWPSAVFRAFQLDGRSTYFLVGHNVQAELSKLGYTESDMIYFHYSLIEVHLTSLCRKRADNVLLCSFLLGVRSFSS